LFGRRRSCAEASEGNAASRQAMTQKRRMMSSIKW
jgi:hypothetical protein